MAGRIQVLDDALVDQIAAGEVVERPASVVKELVENSIDAGASRIRVEIADGGVGLVRVVDDGVGMGAEDARLCVRRHATSKIASATDLVGVATLGFRGEALAAIASVSQLRVRTRERGAEHAIELDVLPDGRVEVREAAGAIGTTIEVEDLFANVPARRKFLKSPATESAHIADIVLRAALSRPDLGFTLVREGKTSREYLPSKGPEARARAVFPEESLTVIADTRDGVEVHALLAAPERARSASTALYVYVNGRPVRDRALARAVAFAYGSVLPAGRFPIGVVYVDIDPRDVDVNVHPTKAEVRFVRAQQVFEAVTRTLAKGLGTTAWGANRGRERWGFTVPSGSGSAPPPVADPDSVPRSPPVTAARPLPLPSSVSDPLSLYSPSPRFASLRVLGQSRGLFIVAESASGIEIIDQHAADERVRFDALRRAYRASEVKTQQLLFPERVECSAREAVWVDRERDSLLSLGLDVSAAGESTVIVRAVPQLLSRASGERLVRDVIDECMHRDERAFGDQVDMVLATMACHAALRSGDKLSIGECESLLAALDGVEEHGGHCPHGRPVIVALSFDELERRLGR